MLDHELSPPARKIFYDRALEEAATDPDPVHPGGTPGPAASVALMSERELRLYEGLFLLLCRLRAASADSIWRLFLLGTLGVTSRSAAMRHIERLVETSYLQHKRLSAWRSVYHLTHRALVTFPSVRARGTSAMRKPQSTSQSHYFWLRASFHAELVADGFTVGRGPRELAALRRFYVDAQLKRIAILGSGSDGRGTGGESARAAAENILVHLRAEESLKPPFRARCSRCDCRSPLNVATEACRKCGARTKNEIPLRVYRCRACKGLADDLRAHVSTGEGAEPGELCAGTLREIDVVPIDIAWKKIGGRYDVLGLFIDDPKRAMAPQLEEIPAQIIGLEPLRLIVRSTDPRSRFNARTQTWRARGPRHMALLHAFTADAKEALFPFSLTTKVIDYRPQLELWAIYPGVKRC
jgi:hypothetical protein